MTLNELAIATVELKKTLENSQQVAKKFISVLDDMGNKKHRKFKEYSEQTQQIQEFLIQVDDSGQLEKKVLG